MLRRICPEDPGVVIHRAIIFCIKLNYQLVTAAAYSFGLIVFALFGALFFLQKRAARGLN